MADIVAFQPRLPAGAPNSGVLPAATPNTHLENGLYAAVMVVPVHNEAGEIAEFLRQWHREIPDMPLILVFDRCTDNSLEVAQKAADGILAARAARARPDVPVFLHMEVLRFNPLGKSGACLCGLWAALRRNVGGNIPVIFWDADNEYALNRGFIDSVVHWVLHNGGLASGIRSGRKLWKSRWALAATRLTLRYFTRKPPPADVLTGVHALPLGHVLFAMNGARTFDMETRLVHYALKQGLPHWEGEVAYFPRTEGKKIRAYHLWGILLAASGFR